MASRWHVPPILQSVSMPLPIDSYHQLTSPGLKGYMYIERIVSDVFRFGIFLRWKTYTAWENVYMLFTCKVPKSLTSSFENKPRPISQRFLRSPRSWRRTGCCRGWSLRLDRSGRRWCRHVEFLQRHLLDVLGFLSNQTDRLIGHVWLSPRGTKHQIETIYVNW